MENRVHRLTRHCARPTIAAGVVVGLALVAGLMTPAASAATGDPIGQGKRTCVPGPKADCSGVVHKWAFEHHGNLAGASFMRAQIHGADLRGANLRGADMRGVGLRHGDLRDANLRNADFGPVSKKDADKAIKRVSRSQLRTIPSVDWGMASFCNSESLSDVNCYNGMLSGADLSGADLTNANFSLAEIDDTKFTGANLTGATFITTNLNHVNFSNANLTGANLAVGSSVQVTWSNTTCPDGTVTSSGCPLNDDYAYTKVASANS